MDVEKLSMHLEMGLAVSFTEEELLEARKDLENSLVVKLVGGRNFNRSSFKTILKKLWCPEGGLNFSEVEGNILIAKFARKEDMEKVM